MYAYKYRKHSIKNDSDTIKQKKKRKLDIKYIQSVDLTKRTRGNLFIRK